jgi:hypothetical protein
VRRGWSPGPAFWRRWRVAIVLAALAASPAAAGRDATLLHERIPPDPHDDIAMGVVLEGDIPAAIETKSGVFSAPDPNRTPTAAELDAARRAAQASEGVSNTFTPDRDTRRPNVMEYGDPFTPSTAPFKRLVAFDAVDSTFALYSYFPRPTTLPVVHGQAAAGEDVFYADLPVDLAPDKHTRIPSVGPGARVLHAHLGVGPRELPIMLSHDGADNWFIDGAERTNARLVMELAIPRAAFGGDFGDPDWTMLGATPVPENVAAAAKDVIAHIGLGRNLRPAENVRKMVAYFRAFVDSDVPLAASKDVYTDLAMSQKGVCRHRAYAFTITALALGIPTRMVMNEAHAWVEVYDGSLWRRIDLGGAGRMLSEQAKTAEPYAGPNDEFPWPANATRGEDLTEKARHITTPGPGPGGPGTGPGAASSASSAASQPPSPKDPSDKRPAAKLAIDLGEPDVMRGAPVHVHGRVTADGSACKGVAVNVSLYDPKSRREARIGTVATDDKGAFTAAIVLPSTVPLGDYQVVARTDGDSQCGPGASQ